jgi:hypothetical protein
VLEVRLRGDVGEDRLGGAHLVHAGDERKSQAQVAPVVGAEDPFELPPERVL